MSQAPPVRGSGAVVVRSPSARTARSFCSGYFYLGHARSALPKWELGAYSETELFLTTDRMKLNFVKTRDGQVTEVIVTQPDKTWEAERVARP